MNNATKLNNEIQDYKDDIIKLEERISQLEDKQRLIEDQLSFDNGELQGIAYVTEGDNPELSLYPRTLDPKTALKLAIFIYDMFSDREDK